jgi:hypothetical protein
VADFKIGTVTHYYDQLGMAIVELVAALHKGDRIRISGSVEFSQLVDVIQVETEHLEFAQSGETVGLAVKQPVAPGDEIVKMS